MILPILEKTCPTLLFFLNPLNQYPELGNMKMKVTNSNNLSLCHLRISYLGLHSNGKNKLNEDCKISQSSNMKQLWLPLAV